MNTFILYICTLCIVTSSILVIASFPTPNFTSACKLQAIVVVALCTQCSVTFKRFVVVGDNKPEYSLSSIAVCVCQVVVIVFVVACSVIYRW